MGEMRTIALEDSMSIVDAVAIGVAWRSLCSQRREHIVAFLSTVVVVGRVHRVQMRRSDKSVVVL